MKNWTDLDSLSYVSPAGMSAMIQQMIQRKREQSSPYNEICEAIILQAVTDYRKELKKLQRKPNKWIIEKIAEIEEFFQSKWFQDISPIDGVWLMERLRLEVRSLAVAA